MARTKLVVCFLTVKVLGKRHALEQCIDAMVSPRTLLENMLMTKWITERYV